MIHSTHSKCILDTCHIPLQQPTISHESSESDSTCECGKLSFRSVWGDQYIQYWSTCRGTPVLTHSYWSSICVCSFQVFFNLLAQKYNTWIACWHILIGTTRETYRMHCLSMVFFFYTMMIVSLNIEHLSNKFLGSVPFLCVYCSGTPFGRRYRLTVNNILYPLFPAR